MENRWRFAFFSAALLLAACGHEQPGGSRKETFPVTGQVFVDGSPTENVAVLFHDAKNLSQAAAAQPSTQTDKEGKFRIATYQNADGVPEGDYVLTFFQKDFDLMKMTYKGEDKLNDRYSDPTKSEIKISVKKGQVNDLGRIELKTK